MESDVLVGLGSRKLAVTPFPDKPTLQAAVDAWVGSNGVTYDSSTYGSIEDWNTSMITDMGYLFNSATYFNADISRWDVSNSKNFKHMFKSALMFNADISRWNVSKSTSFEYMFFSAEIFNADISRWDVSNSKTFKYMLSQTPLLFNADISRWDVSQSTNFFAMFYGGSAFNQDISGWDFGNDAIDFRYMFLQAKSFKQTLCWDLSCADSSVDRCNVGKMFHGSPGIADHEAEK